MLKTSYCLESTGILVMPVTSRAIALGEAYTSSEGDVLGILYNPSCFYNSQVTAFYQKGIADDILGVIGAGYKTEFGNVALAISYYNVGSIDLVNLNGQERTVNAQTDFLGIVSYNKDFFKRFSIGFNVKYLYSRLVEDVSSNTFTYDVGASCKIIDEMMIGVSAQNINAKIKYIEEEYNMPLSIRAGCSYKIQLTDMQSLMPIVDVARIDNKMRYHGGIEYTYNGKILEALGIGDITNESFSLRVGYKIGYDMGKLRFGFGYTQDRYTFDYAISLMSEFGSVHYVSFTYVFGDKPKRRRQ
jgi:hypothetical protein